MPRFNKNLANLPIRKCKHHGCQKNGIAYCIFASKQKGAPPIWMGYLCEDHFNKYHRKYVAGQWN